jgi:hypothetical protein
MPPSWRGIERMPAMRRTDLRRPFVGLAVGWIVACAVLLLKPASHDSLVPAGLLIRPAPIMLSM